MINLIFSALKTPLELQGSTNAKIHSRHFGDRRDFTVAKPDFTVARFFLS